MFFKTARAEVQRKGTQRAERATVLEKRQSDEKSSSPTKSSGRRSAKGSSRTPLQPRLEPGDVLKKRPEQKSNEKEGHSERSEQPRQRNGSPTKRAAVRRKVPAEGQRRGLHALLCSPGWNQEMFLKTARAEVQRKGRTQRAKRATALEKRQSDEKNGSPTVVQR